MREFSKGDTDISSVLDAVVEYDQFCSPNKDKREEYRQVLEFKPWRVCACDVCRQLDYHVILFRGAERNRRRGFHNVWTFFNRVKGMDLDAPSEFTLSES